jgi:hypothetical protein
MKPPKKHPDLVSGSDGVLLHAWVQSADAMTVDECAHHVSYLLEIFSRVTSKNERVSPRRALKALLAKAQEHFNENYPAVYGDPDKEPPAPPKEPATKKRPWIIYTGKFESDRRRH